MSTVTKDKEMLCGKITHAHFVYEWKKEQSALQQYSKKILSSFHVVRAVDIEVAVWMRLQVKDGSAFFGTHP